MELESLSFFVPKLVFVFYPFFTLLRSNLLDAICFGLIFFFFVFSKQNSQLLDAALGMDSKRLRIANYSELIPVDQIYDKILPNVQLTIIKEPRSKKQKEQKFVLLSRLIR